MKKVFLQIPSLEEYWYEKNILSDPDTMNYNAGYDVNYYGYNYDTGCIDFPKDKWEDKYNKRKEANNYFALIKDEDLNVFIGYCNYQYNKSNNRYECGILIEAKYRGKGYSKPALELLCSKAKENGIKELYDSFEMDRNYTLDVFIKSGFEVIEEVTWKRFNKDVKGVVVKKNL